jgi:hypothetical protein
MQITTVLTDVWNAIFINQDYQLCFDLWNIFILSKTVRLCQTSGKYLISISPSLIDLSATNLVHKG